MAQTVDFFLDDGAADAVRVLWRRLAAARLPAPDGPNGNRPHVRFAAAGDIPPRTAPTPPGALPGLSLPGPWRATVGSVPAPPGLPWLGAVVDAELLAVHSAVHDVLAGAVRQPSASYLPGSWVPHCTLAEELTAGQLAAAVEALHPVSPIRAGIAEVAITDSRTGDVDVLRRR